MSNKELDKILSHYKEVHGLVGYTVSCSKIIVMDAVKKPDPDLYSDYRDPVTKRLRGKRQKEK